MGSDRSEARRPRVAADRAHAAEPVAAERTAPAAYRLEDQVGYLLRLASQRHAAIFQAEMGGETTPTQWAALARLLELGGCSQNRLGRSIGLDAATIKGVVDRLAARGLVQAAADPRDGRRRVVRLTSPGRGHVEARLQAARAISAATLAPLGAADRRLLIELLTRIG